MPAPRAGSYAQWFLMAKIRHKISSFDVISRVFPSKFQQIYNYFRFRGMSFYTQNLSNCCKCKYDPSISRISKIYFGQIFVIWSSYESARWSAAVRRRRRAPATEAKLQLFCPCLAVTAARCALYWHWLTLALVGLHTLLKGFLLYFEGRSWLSPCGCLLQL